MYSLARRSRIEQDTDVPTFAGTNIAEWERYLPGRHGFCKHSYGEMALFTSGRTGNSINRNRGKRLSLAGHGDISWPFREGHPPACLKRSTFFFNFKFIYVFIYLERERERESKSTSGVAVEREK